MRLVATILDPAVIRELLAHLGLSRPAPPEPSAAAPLSGRFEAGGLSRRLLNLAERGGSTL